MFYVKDKNLHLCHGADIQLSHCIYTNTSFDVRYGCHLMDWSLITGRGWVGYTMGGWGHVKFYPYEKGAAGA